jgi:hypothetical protein
MQLSVSAMQLLLLRLPKLCRITESKSCCGCPLHVAVRLPPLLLRFWKLFSSLLPRCLSAFYALAFVPQVWKPFSSSYQYAVKQLGVSAERVCMVASHPWDIAGAMQVRLLRL